MSFMAKMNYRNIYHLCDTSRLSENTEEMCFFRFRNRNINYSALSAVADSPCLFSVVSAAHYEVGDAHLTVRRDRPDYQLLFTVNGEGLVEYGGQQYRLQPGSALLVNCMLPHRHRVPEGCFWEQKHIHFTTTDPSLLLDKVPIYMENGGKAMRYLDELIAFSSSVEAMSEVAPAVYSQLVTDMLTALIRQEYAVSLNQTQKQLHAVVQYIHEHYDQPLTIDQLAEHFHYSQGYLIASFKRQYSTTPHRYLIRYRLRQAQEQILAGETVSRAALACGFNSTSAYYHAVKTLQKP